MSATKPKPVAVCTRCGYYGHHVEDINQPCSQRHDGGRCKGTLRSAVSVGDWEECASAREAAGSARHTAATAKPPAGCSSVLASRARGEHRP